MTQDTVFLFCLCLEFSLPTLLEGCSTEELGGETLNRERFATEPETDPDVVLKHSEAEM